MDNILNNLGMCMRAGFIVTGEEMVLNKVRNNDICYIFLANDAGKNTTKAILDKAKFYNVDVCTDYNTIELSLAIGKENRKVIGVSSKGKGFLKILRK